MAFDRLNDYFAGRPARDAVPVPAVAKPSRDRPLRRLLRRRGVGWLRYLARLRLRRQRPTLVAITGTQILVDGTPAGSTRAIEEANRLQRVDELFNMLKNKRELWKQINPGKEFPGVAVLQVDKHVPALVVKSVFQTAAFAGYPNISFMVGRLGNEGG